MLFQKNWNLGVPLYTLYLHDNNLIRVNGRLRKSKLPSNRATPIDHHVSLFLYATIITLHVSNFIFKFHQSTKKVFVYIYILNIHFQCLQYYVKYLVFLKSLKQFFQSKLKIMLKKVFSEHIVKYDLFYYLNI